MNIIVDLFQETSSSCIESIIADNLTNLCCRRQGGELANDEMQTMTVRYNCAAGGSAIITVRMDLEDDALESVTWSW